MDVVVVLSLLGLVGVLRTVVAVRSGVSDESLVEVGDVVILLALVVVVAVWSVRHADSVVSQTGVGVVVVLILFVGSLALVVVVVDDGVGGVSDGGVDYGGVADKVVVILILLVGGQESW